MLFTISNSAVCWISPALLSKNGTQTEYTTVFQRARREMNIHRLAADIRKAIFLLSDTLICREISYEMRRTNSWRHRQTPA